MKKHLIAFFAGMLSIWLLTAFMNAELNPFNLSEGERSGMVAAFAISQFFIHFGLIGYNDKYN